MIHDRKEETELGHDNDFKAFRNECHDIGTMVEEDSLERISITEFFT